MSEYLVIRLGHDPSQLAHWIAVDSTGARLSPPVAGMLAEATADLGDRKVIVLVPSAEVLTTSVDIPVKGAKLQAALPYALEEHLAEDVEELHFAAGSRRSSGHTPVSVVSQQCMQEWMSRLSEATITPLIRSLLKVTGSPEYPALSVCCLPTISYSSTTVVT